MGRQVVVVFYVVAMAAVIVGVDVVFFRNHFWERLTVNIGTVLVFAAFYFNSSGVHEPRLTVFVDTKRLAMSKKTP